MTIPINWEQRYCPHCKDIFFVRTMRLKESKTLSCYMCGKRFKVYDERRTNDS